MAGSKACSTPARSISGARTKSRRRQSASRRGTSAASSPSLPAARWPDPALDIPTRTRKGRHMPALFASARGLPRPGLRLAKGGAGGGAMIGGRLGRADLEFAPFPHRHCAFAAQDIAPHLDQFIDGYVRQSAVVIAENRGVEAAVLAVGGDDGMVRAVVDGDPVDQDLVALFQIVFEPGKGADARPPAAPGLDVAPDDALLLLAQGDFGHYAFPQDLIAGKKVRPGRLRPRLLLKDGLS